MEKEVKELKNLVNEQEIEYNQLLQSKIKIEKENEKLKKENEKLLQQVYLLQTQ